MTFTYQHVNTPELELFNTQRPHTDGIKTLNRYRIKRRDVWYWARYVRVCSYGGGGVPRSYQIILPKFESKNVYVTSWLHV